jgi:2',3'-cyclic-nucleotide 2'-phosphodiesterase (5'-nucleotidase family)
MHTNKSQKVLTILVTLIMIFSMLFTPGAIPSAQAAPSVPVTFTILHTNDFHGQLEPANVDPNKISTPGMARTAKVINDIRAAKGAVNVLLVDPGDEMQGSLLSNLGDGTATGKGIPTIATYNEMQYDVATFGNHEFDWGQENLGNRTFEANYPYVTANIVKMDGADCASSGWNKPDFADAPYTIKTMGTAPDTVDVAFIGVTTTETPTITVATATSGLCFKDPATAVVHYYDQMKADGADVIVVLSHLGFNDGGYGYGIPVYGDAGTATDSSTGLAGKLISAGKPVNLIIGGHSHTSVAAPGTTVTVAGKTGSTLVVQAAYNGRRVGQADVTVGTDGKVSISWKVTVWTQQNLTATPPISASVWRTYTTSSAFTENTDVSQDPTINTLITSYATDPDYLAIVNQPIGYSAVDLGRSNTVDNMMGSFVDDAIYNYLNADGDSTNDVDIFFNNAGGLRTDWCYVSGAWQTSGCVTGTHDAGLLTYGNMFTVLPFGNATVVGQMTGAKILEVLHNAAQIANSASSPAGAIQPAGLKYKYYAYRDANPGPQPYAWGAYDVTVYDKDTDAWMPLDLKKTYSVGTNEFLAPAGGDNYFGFKYMTNVTYWGDMLNAVNAYVTANYGTVGTAYLGPNGDGSLDSRILRDGNGNTTYDGGGEIVPLTILHHNDSHGNVYKGSFVGYTQLATLIKQERLHNPTRTLLLNSGDDIQGDGFSFFYKSSYTGKAVDGTDLAPALWTNPVMAVMNSMNYDAMTLGNHEFNFGSDVFKGVLGQAAFPVLQANVADSGAYGLAAANGGVGVQPYVTKTVGAEGIKVAILGIGNHRVPNYELPSNIPGLIFSDPIVKAQELSTALRGTNDVLIALTHIGFTENPASVEVDANVDTNLVATVTGLDALVGGHSHTNPATGFGAYKYLPSIVVDPDGKPVIVGQAYRYNNTLGEEVLGLRAKGGGGYEVVSGTGRYLSVAMSTAEDAATKAIVDPYLTPFNTYNNTVVGVTTTPIDALQAFTQETSGANIQADASIYELTKNGVTPDFHLSGAMTNKATSGPYPQTLKVSDMFTLMPYENSLVVISMNGPQLKAVLERAYRNYYYYKYVPGYGGYSYYTTCMLDTNFGNQITYNDLYPDLPNGHNVVSLTIGGVPVDFADASTYYNVSTVNYLAAGSCNFNDAGVTLWPLAQIVADTQYYVRDAVIDYITYKGTVSPVIEGRLSFITDTTAPVITIVAPTATSYLHPTSLKLDFIAEDVGPAGLKDVWADLDGVAVINGQVIDLYTLALGDHTLTVYAMDKAYNQSSKSVTFKIIATTESLLSGVTRFYSEGKIDNQGIANSLTKKVENAQKSLEKGKPDTAINQLNAFINEVQAQSGKHITTEAANLLIADAQWVIAHLK